MSSTLLGYSTSFPFSCVCTKKMQEKIKNRYARNLENYKNPRYRPLLHNERPFGVRLALPLAQYDAWQKHAISYIIKKCAYAHTLTLAPRS